LSEFTSTAVLASGELGTERGQIFLKVSSPWFLSFFFFFFILVVLGFELQYLAFTRQARCHLSHTSALFALDIFQIGSCTYAQACLD
jgi:hypothetical protein